MTDFQEGDVFSFHLRDDRFGLGKVLLIDPLSASQRGDIYHVAVYDAVLEAGEGGIDESGEEYERSHEMTGDERNTLVVDHLAIWTDAFVGSMPLFIEHDPVKEDELEGYRLFLHNHVEGMVSAGKLRSTPDQSEEVAEEELADENVAADDDATDEGSSDAGAEPARPEPEPLEPGEELHVAIHPWHRVVYEAPLGRVLVQLQEEFKGDEFRSTVLGSFILSRLDERNMDEVRELATRLVEGDYGAGYELLEFGDLAADALEEQLRNDPSPEAAGDILNILTDLGSERGYEHVATFLDAHRGRLDDPLRTPALRGYCYAVMVTSGLPQPLRQRISVLDEIDDPDLADDLRLARAAVEKTLRDQPPEVEASKPRLSDPFGM